jgi:RNA methyltransferase, TrmH family
MISKSESKYIQSLSHKKQRNEHKLFIAEGPKLVEEILQSQYDIEKIFATQEWINNNPTSTLVSIVTNDELQKISTMQTANQVLAVVKMIENNASINTKNKLSVVLDGIQDPGNFGTIIRIADWFGINNLVCSNDCVELYNPKVIQSTMGSFTRVNITYTDLQPFLQQTNLPIYGALLNGKNVKEIAPPLEGFLIIGNEGNGIRENILPYITNAVSIKKVGGAESLNAAVATGILLSYLM